MAEDNTFTHKVKVKQADKHTDTMEMSKARKKTRKRAIGDCRPSPGLVLCGVFCVARN